MYAINSKFYLTDSVRALEIYKITMIFASCLLAMVLIAFLYCILKKSFCSPRSHASRVPPDIMTLFAESANDSGGPFNIQPPFEKPPTYDESQNQMREVFGVPPPSYPGPSAIREGDQASTSHGSSPSTSLDSSGAQIVTIEVQITPAAPEATGVENRGFQPE